MLGTDRPPPRCPTCNAPLTGDGIDPKKTPFCSDRCKLVDLSRWLSEEYRVPGSMMGDGGADDDPFGESEDL